jgi:hypothetical protein
MALPVFVGAPGDGSVFLNSMKLWAMREAGLIDSYQFDLDLHAEIYEACAYHRWGLFDNPPHQLATLILGGGVPKNYNLQPEPALGQVLGIPHVRGYNFDVQIVSAPVTDGSLSSCPPGEAVTWGKVDKDTYQQATESMQADYSTLMPFLAKALLDNRERFERLAAEIGEEKCSRSNRRRAVTCGPGKATGCSTGGRSCAGGLLRMCGPIRSGCWRRCSIRWLRGNPHFSHIFEPRWHFFRRQDSTLCCWPATVSR